MSRGTKWLIGCLVGGCGGALLLMVLAVVVGGIMASRFVSFQAGASLPADFPVYPGARQQTAFTLKPRSGDPASAVTLVQWQVVARGDKVAAWYRDHLNQGDWEVVREDSTGITLRRHSTGARALLQIRDQFTQTLVQLATSGDQPLRRGAHPAPSDSPLPEISP
jgi:hypothetical protein